MTLNANLPRRRLHVSLVFAALLILGACSKQASSGNAPATAPAQTSGAAGSDIPVTIIREGVLREPKEFIALIRNDITKCQAVRAAMGISESDAPKITDEQILQLDTERIEERFSGGRYSQDRRYSHIDFKNFDPEKSCIPKALHYRRLEIRPDRCMSIKIGYDLDKGTGTYEEGKVCNPWPNHTVDARGEVVQLAGQTCRWDTPKGAAPVRDCLLEPMHSDGYGRKMVVQTEFDPQSGPPGLQRVQVRIEKLVSLDVGSPIPSHFFEAPADSNNFPRKVVGK